MNKRRNRLALVTLLLALALVCTPFASMATAVAATSEALTLEEISLYPLREITRAEFAMLLGSTLGLPELPGVGFSDVPATHPYANAIATAQAIGFMGGYGDGIFLPDNPISGAEAASMEGESPERFPICGGTPASSSWRRE